MEERMHAHVSRSANRPATREHGHHGHTHGATRPIVHCARRLTHPFRDENLSLRVIVACVGLLWVQACGSAGIFVGAGMFMLTCWKGEGEGGDARHHEDHVVSRIYGVE